MDGNQFDSDRKYCPKCQAYVAYLRSIETSFCAECGARVRLFSDSDGAAFRALLKTARGDLGRPFEDGERESA